MLATLTGDISRSVGDTLTKEVEKMLDSFATNSETIETNLQSLRQRIDDLEHNVIAAINKDKQVAIDSLKEENKNLSEQIKDKDA